MWAPRLKKLASEAVLRSELLVVRTKYTVLECVLRKEGLKYR